MTISVQNTERVLRVFIERAPLNILDLETLGDLDKVIAQTASDPSVDVVVLQGSGQRAFSAGVDVRDHTRDRVPAMLTVVHRVMRRLLAIPQITVAMVRGLCLGGGCELVSCCDLVIASDDSVFATPEIHVGCYPPMALARFASLIGYHRAAEMILTGRRYSAQEAANYGIVNRVVPGDQLESSLASLLEELLGKSSAVMRIALKGLREISLRGFDDSLRRSEEIYCTELLQTADVEEGVQAFLAKRTPRWFHR